MALGETLYQSTGRDQTCLVVLRPRHGTSTVAHFLAPLAKTAGAGRRSPRHRGRPRVPLRGGGGPYNAASRRIRETTVVRGSPLPAKPA